MPFMVKHSKEQRPHPLPGPAAPPSSTTLVGITRLLTRRRTSPWSSSPTCPYGRIIAVDARSYDLQPLQLHKSAARQERHGVLRYDQLLGRRSQGVRVPVIAVMGVGGRGTVSIRLAQHHLPVRGARSRQQQPLPLLRRQRMAGDTVVCHDEDCDDVHSTRSSSPAACFCRSQTSDARDSVHASPSTPQLRPVGTSCTRAAHPANCRRGRDRARAMGSVRPRPSSRSCADRLTNAKVILVSYSRALCVRQITPRRSRSNCAHGVRPETVRGRSRQPRRRYLDSLCRVDTRNFDYFILDGN
jgi:hypothetical protein